MYYNLLSVLIFDIKTASGRPSGGCSPRGRGWGERPTPPPARSMFVPVRRQGIGCASSPRPVPALRCGLRPPGWPLTPALHYQADFQADESRVKPAAESREGEGFRRAQTVSRARSPEGVRR